VGDKENKESMQGKKKGLNLNMKQLGNNADYQDEFMANYENFSQSWRDQIDKGKKLK